VIAYAAWISAAFHLKVIRVFLDSVSTPPAQPALPCRPLSLDMSPEVLPALDGKAWELAAQAHQIIREHLRTSVAWHCISGTSVRKTDIPKALDLIANTTLDDALTPQDMSLTLMLTMSEAIADSARRYADSVKRGVTTLRQRGGLPGYVLAAGKTY